MQTIGELAKRLGVSKTAINNKINKLNMRDDLQKVDGTYFLTDEQAATIGQNLKKIRTNNFTGELSEVEEEITDAQQRYIKMLSDMLTQKDKQIDRLHDEIETLHNLLSQQQQISKTLQQHIEILENRQQKGLFSRLFGRKEAPQLTDKAQEPTPQAEGSDGES